MQKRFRKETAGLKGEHVVGVVVAYGGEVAWSDIFASADLFNAYWNKLLRSYAVEAVARPTCAKSQRQSRQANFCNGGRVGNRRNRRQGFTAGERSSDGSISQIELDSLEPKVITIHRMVLRKSS